MTAAGRPAPHQRVEAFVTGAWLALWQVALAATLLRTAGATMQSFFALTATWLLGGVIGVRWALARAAASQPEPEASAGRQELPGTRWLLPLALLLGVGAKGLGAARPFSPVAAALILAAGGAAGGYAGLFIATRAPRWPDAARLLLTENNGFILGYAGAFALLLWRAPWLDGAALALGTGLAVAGRDSGALRPALALGAASALYYLLCPYVGDRGWDGLMTATVLAHPDWVTAREVLFFAHPLVIPLTAPLAWLGLLPLHAAAAREALCAGGVVALCYLAAAALAQSRRAGVLAAALLTLAVWRWRLATCGEEKEAAMLFGAGFLFLYLDHRGLWDLQLPRWRTRSLWQRRGILAGLLALSIAVHIVNAALVGVVLADMGLTRPPGSRRSAVREGLWTLSGAAALAGPFFLWLAAGPGGARTAKAVLGYFFEYHLSGEFLSLPWRETPSLPAALGERALVVYASARGWLLGTPDNATPGPGIGEGVLVLAVLGALLVPLIRRGPGATRRLLGWALLIFLHAFVFDSANPESVAPAMTLLVVMAAASLLRPPRIGQPDTGQRLGRSGAARSLVAAVALAAVAGTHVGAERAARRQAQQVRALVAPAVPSPVPLGDLCRLLDAELPRQALLLVSDRLHASYFHLYTSRRPLITEYLDASPEVLRQRFALTSLSLRVYRPELGSAAIDAAIRAGRPVYLLSAELRPELPQRELPWDGLHLYTLSPSPDAPAPAGPE